jgi:zeta-carotene desaturase
MFGPDPKSAAIALPTKPLHMMYAEPARLYIESHGGAVRTGAPAKIRVDEGTVASVSSGGDEWRAPAVVSAVPWHALGDLITGTSRALAPTLERARTTASSPIVTVNLWLDRVLFDEPFIGLPGRRMQWVFDKRAVFGGEAAHLSLVSSGASSIAALGNDDLIRLAFEEIVEAFPRARSVRLVRGTVIREPHATFSLAPGQPARPDTITPVGGLFLAGDWIATGLPATIESAVRSGHRAADAATASTIRSN